MTTRLRAAVLVTASVAAILGVILGRWLFTVAS